MLNDVYTGLLVKPLTRSMDFVHTDKDEEILSETLLKNEIKVEIGKNHTRAKRQFSPFSRQVSVTEQKQFLKEFP